MKRQIVVFATVFLSLLLATTALAHDAGQWVYRVGVGVVDPDDKNLVLDETTYIGVESGASVTLDLTYFFKPNFAVDILAALPFKHDIELVANGSAAKVAETKHLPPTVSLQYHFIPDGDFQPYVGLGANWTTFFNVETSGALAGVDLDLDDSFGVAAQIGGDWLIGEDWLFNVDVRYIEIETDAKADGSALGKVAIDPWVFALSIGYRF